MYFQRSLNRLYIAGAAVLMLATPHLAQAQLGKVNGPQNLLGQATWASGAGYSGLFGFTGVSFDVIADLDFNGSYNASTEHATGGSAGIFKADTKVGSTVVSEVSVCNDLFHFADNNVSTNAYQLTADDNANKYKITTLIEDILTSKVATVDLNLAAGVTGTNAEKSAGFQIAIWELWYDDGANLFTKGLNFSSQPSQARGFSLDSSMIGSNIATNANAYIAYANANLRTTSSLTAVRLVDVTDPIKQGQLIVTDAPIPEPAFYQMAGLLTMGILGVRRLRKKA